jgi:hypothetical protein
LRAQFMHRLAAICFLIFFSLVDAVCGRQAAGARASEPHHNIQHPDAYSEDAVKHYNDAVKAHQDGFFDKAITEYIAAVDADSRCPFGVLSNFA